MKLVPYADLVDSNRVWAAHLRRRLKRDGEMRRIAFPNGKDGR